MSPDTPGPESIVRVKSDLAPLIPKFLANRARDVERLREAVAQGDFDTIGTVGHTMAGTGSTYGFDWVSLAGRAVESAAKRKDHDDVARWVDGLAEFLARVSVEFV